MTRSQQSPSTLRELLSEAWDRLEGVPSASTQERLSQKIEELERSIDQESPVSADVEQQVVSVRVLVEIERSRHGGGGA